MIKKALVLLLPPEPKRSDIVSPLDRLAGLPLMQRTLSSLQWAGIEEGLLFPRDAWTEREHRILEDPRNNGFSWFSTEAGREDTPSTDSDPGTGEEDFVVVFPHWIVDRKVLKDLCGKPETLSEVILLDPPPSSSPPGEGMPALALVPGALSRAVHQDFARGTPPDQVIRRLRETAAVRREQLPEGALIRVERQSDLAGAERELFRRLIKPTESFLSRRFERKVSMAITRRLLHARVTPNQISVASILLGVLSALLFLGDSRILHVTGGLLLVFSSIVDGCDGELARLRFQESRRGSWLDFLGDNVVHVFVFLCLGLGLYLRGEGTVYAVLGYLAALANVGAASAVFFRVFLKSRDGVITFATPVRLEEMDRAQGWLRRRIEFIDKLSNRDFFYLILICAAIGQLWIFMWVAALGALFYFFNLIYLYYRMRAVPNRS